VRVVTKKNWSENGFGKGLKQSYLGTQISGSSGADLPCSWGCFFLRNFRGVFGVSSAEGLELCLWALKEMAFVKKKEIARAPLIEKQPCMPSNWVEASFLLSLSSRDDTLGAGVFGWVIQVSQTQCIAPKLYSTRPLAVWCLRCNGVSLGTAVIPPLAWIIWLGA